MTLHTGDKARKNSDYVCSRCGSQVHLTEGERIPRCPNCGNERFDEQKSDTADRKK
jgi:DNA-directed RNA polymerase subunit RPC12/RpoP